MQISLLLLFLHLSSHLLNVSASNPTYLAHHCSKPLDEFNKTIEILSNVNILLFGGVVPGVHHTQFFTGSWGEPLNKVYALGQCAPHSSSSTCNTCIYNASIYLDKTCYHEIEAFVWYADCFIRFSATSFFGLPTTAPSLFFPTSSHTFETASHLLPLLTQLSKVAAFHNQHLFATSAFTFERFKLYAIAECTRDLSDKSCLSCLHTAVSVVSKSSNGKTGFRVFLPSCSLRYDTYKFYRGKDEKRWIWYPLSFAALVLALVSIWMYRQCGARKSKNGKTTSQAPEVLDEPLSIPLSSVRDATTNLVLNNRPISIPLSSVRAATNDFSIDKQIGKGGSGFVYKGVLDGKEVAFKRLANCSTNSTSQFETEVGLIAKFQHRNLVKLLGYCSQDPERILVCEYVPNGSLETYLFGDKQGQLTWSQRVRIVDGIARGIFYLHEDSTVTVIHRDLKPDNILLDSKMTPKISDFGLSKTFEDQSAHYTKIVGTRGYMAPEYVFDQRLSTKSDVYSLGIIVLEILSGKRGSTCSELPKYAYDLWCEDKWLMLMDPLLQGFDENEARKYLQIGLLCLQDEDDRPDISEFFHMLSIFPNIPEPKCPYHSSRAGLTMEIIDITKFGRSDATESSRSSRTLIKEESGDIEMG